MPVVSAASKARFSLRTLTLEDYASVKALQDSVYAHMQGAWPLKKYQSQLLTYPKGQLCVVEGTKVVGIAMSFRVPLASVQQAHSFSEITSNGYLCDHDDRANTLYGIELAVHKHYQRQGVATFLYQGRDQLAQTEKGIQYIAFGGRLPGYAACQSQQSPKAYVELVQKGELVDPVASFHFAMGFKCADVYQYQPADKPSCGFAALMMKRCE